mgnify:CR=1 FL=1
MKPSSSSRIYNKADKSASNSLNPSIFEGLVTLCAPDAVCFSRHIPHASGRILAERFYVIGTLQSNCKVGQRVFVFFPLIKPYVKFSLIRLSDILRHVHYGHTTDSFLSLYLVISLTMLRLLRLFLLFLRLL